MTVQNLTPTQKLSLVKEEWAIHTKHKITEQGLTAFLAQKGLDYESKTNIFVRGKQKPVFFTDFEAVLYLALNRTDGPYSFEAYHRKNDKYQWELWGENGKTPIQKLKDEFPLTAEGVKSAALKKKKRDSLLEKSEKKPARTVSIKKSALIP